MKAAKLIATFAGFILANGAQEPPSIDWDEALGRQISWESAKYPKDALTNKAQGTVVLRLTVGKDGKVTRVDVVSGQPELQMLQCTRRANGSMFLSFRDGKPIEAHTIVSVNFKLNDRGKPEITAQCNDAPPTFATVFNIGGGVTPPHPIYTPYPEYSEEARGNKYSGTCVLN